MNMSADEEGLVPIGRVAAELGLSTSRIRALTDEGVFTPVRTPGGHRRYDLRAARTAWLHHKIAQSGLRNRDGQITLAQESSVLVRGRVELPGETAVLLPATASAIFARTLPLVGLDEDLVWRQLRPLLENRAGPAALTILRYAFTEMLNNAIDHSAGTTVAIRGWQESDTLEMLVSDDGTGVFAHLSAGLGLADDFESIQELTKGKRTTAPDRHTGEGIFFTSKAVDVFRLSAGGLAWTVDNLRRDQAVGEAPAAAGTAVHLLLDLQTHRDLGALFREFTVDTRFTRSRPVVKLFAYGVTFVSRSEAKRLLAGMERFTEVEVDFTGVSDVGQGFVDELLRVWPSDNPGTKIIPSNMAPAVEFMVTRGLPPGD